MRIVRLVTSLLCAAAAAGAHAQSQTFAPPAQFELERLQLDPSARGSLVLGSGEVGPRNSFRLSFAGHWEHRPLVLVGSTDLLGRRGDGAARGVVEDRFSVLATADYVVLPRLELYARGTYVVDQYGENSFDPPDKNGFGMPSFGVRFGALQQADGAPMNVALAIEFMPPWGTPGAIAKFTDPGALFRLEVGRWHGPVLAAANAALLTRSSVNLGERVLASEAQFGAVVALKGVVSPELSYRGGVDLQGGLPSSELLAGVRGRVGPLEIFALGGPGFWNRPGTPQWRALAGLALAVDGPTAKKEEPPPPPPPPLPPPPRADPCAPGQTHTPAQCPDLDDDGDGVLNKDDLCPREPGPADNHGCPRAVLQKEKVELREKVQFDSGKASIKPVSAPLLDEVAKVMKEHPEIQKVVVEGHTDSTGSKALNRKLSQARAESVVKALVARGVERGRLGAAGFGESRPIAPNDTRAGREANRRVEISIAQMRQ